MIPASFHDSPYLPHCTVNSLHTAQPLKTVYADKGYYGEPKRDFLSLNNIADGIMRKDTMTAKVTPLNTPAESSLTEVTNSSEILPCVLPVSPI
jgi:hypothetical protein